MKNDADDDVSDDVSDDGRVKRLDATDSVGLENDQPEEHDSLKSIVNEALGLVAGDNVSAGKESDSSSATAGSVASCGEEDESTDGKEENGKAVVRGTAERVKYVTEDELAEYDRFKKQRIREGDERFRPDQRPRIEYDELSRLNFTFDGYNTLKNSPVCTSKAKREPGRRVNIDVSLKNLNFKAYKARQLHGLSEYIPLYSGTCTCTSPYCLKCINPLLAPNIVKFGHTDGMQQMKQRSSKSERARRKEENRIAKVKMKSSHSATHAAQAKRPISVAKQPSNGMQKAGMKGDELAAAALALQRKPSEDHLEDDLVDPLPGSQTTAAEVCNPENDTASSPTDQKNVDLQSVEESTERDVHSRPKETTSVIARPSVDAPSVSPSESNGSAAPANDTPESSNACECFPNGSHAVPEDSIAVPACTQPASHQDPSRLSHDTTARKQRLNTCSNCGEVEPQRKAFKKCQRYAAVENNILVC